MQFGEKTISECKLWVEEATLEEVQHALPLLELDQRAGIQALVKQWKRKLKKEEELEKHWLYINEEEKRLRQQGFQYIAGIDEVGRGPLAGPVTTAAVVLPEDFYLPGINDSKQLSMEQRERFAEIIKEKAIAFSIIHIDPITIDQINIYQATIKGMHQAIEELHSPPQYVLVDAMKLSLKIPSKSIIKGDTRSVSIAAASILAKQERDAYMIEQSVYYPPYGFERNMGYGTAHHLEALRKHGATPLHRTSFLPVQQVESLL